MFSEFQLKKSSLSYLHPFKTKVELMVKTLLRILEEGVGEGHKESLQPFLQTAKGLLTER